MPATAPVYACLGLVAFCLNVVVAIAIHLDTQMKNPTYRFMVQLAVADACMIFGMLIGPGIAVSSGYDINSDVVAGKIFAYFKNFGYRVATFFMALIAFSRWVYFVKKQKVDFWFSSRNHKFICAFVWIFVILFASPFLYYPNAFDLIPNSGVYIYTNSTYSRISSTFDQICNLVVMISQILFNAMSMIWIIKLRKQVLTQELKAKNKQELKLYALCLIDSSVFCLLVCVWYISSYMGANEALGVLSEILYLLNHVDCAILYLCLNQKLRLGIINFIKVKIFRKKNDQATSPVIKLTGTASLSHHK